MTFLALDEPTADDLNKAVLRLRQLGRRQSATTTTTTIDDALRLDDLPIYSGRAYRIWAKPTIESTVAADLVQITLRYSTDGSTPTTASSILPGGGIYTRIHTGSSGEDRHMSTIYEPAADQTLSVVLCYARTTGTGNVRLFADATNELQMGVEDCGTAVGDTGTDL